MLALPRGGVPVGFEIARALHAPLDVFLVRKLGYPGQEELAIGAIASGGARLLNSEMIEGLGLSPALVESIAQKESQELQRRERLYRGNPNGGDSGALNVHGQTVVLVDDGMATGYSMRVAIQALRREGPREIVVAVPVASSNACREVEKEADAVVCLHTPLDFFAVGQWYRNFHQVTDAEVRNLLDRANRMPQANQS